MALVLVGVRAAAAEEPKDEKARVDGLVRGLEGADPAARAKAATDLGSTFPEGAAAVDVLLDAVGDEDEAVRNAAIRSLRRLGNAGIAAILRRLPAMPKGATAAVHDSGHLIHALGDGASVVDLATELGLLSARGADAVVGALLVFAAAPPGREALERDRRERCSWFDVVSPWLAAAEAPTVETAAAVLAVCGRSLVASAPWDAKADADLVSPDALAAALESKSPAPRWIAWRVAAAAPRTPTRPSPSSSASPTRPRRARGASPTSRRN